MIAIAAAVIGGVALFGGVGSPLGAFIGAGIISIISNMIVLFGVNVYWQSAVSGIVVVLAISFGSISMMLRERRDRKQDRKSTRLNSSHVAISYAVFCLEKKKLKNEDIKNSLFNGMT